MQDGPTGAPTEGDGAQFPCPQCGARLTFSPEAATLACEHCGHVTDPEGGDAKAIVEHDLQAGLARLASAPASGLMAGGVEVRCNGCGATAVVEGHADSCAFCGAPVVLEPEDDARTLFVPESVLPFAIEKDDVDERFRAWLKSLWFAPSGLERTARKQKVRGVYLPHWTFDSNTTTRYTGLRGEYYYVTESYTDSDGKRRTRSVRKTRWWPASGTVYNQFDDVLVAASESLPRKLLVALEPWDLAALAPFDKGLLSGFIAERYSVGLEQSFELAEDRMEPSIRSTIHRDIGGDTQSITSMHVHHSDTTFKLLLLPLWISAFRHGEKVYRFACNARTGEVQGERPYSALKIAFAVLAAACVIAVVYYLSQQ